MNTQIWVAENVAIGSAHDTKFNPAVHLLVLLSVVWFNRLTGTLTLLNQATRFNTVRGEISGNRLRPFQ